MYSTSHRRYAITQRWNSPLFRNLSPFEKCVYSYLWDNCDLAGFYEIDHSTIEHYNKIPSNEIESILENLSKNEITISNGWLFILDFIEYQGNGNLSPNNNAHKAIISSLSKNMIHFKECLRTQNNLAPYEGLVRGSSKGKGNCLGKSNDKSISLVNNDKETSAHEPTYIESTYDRVYNNRGTPCIRCGTEFNELCKKPQGECVSQSHIAYRERK